MQTGEDDPEIVFSIDNLCLKSKAIPIVTIKFLRMHLSNTPHIVLSMLSNFNFSTAFCAETHSPKKSYRKLPCFNQHTILPPFFLTNNNNWNFFLAFFLGKVHVK